MVQQADPYATQKELYDYETPADTLLWKNHARGTKHIRVILPDYAWEFSDEGYVGRGVSQKL